MDRAMCKAGLSTRRNSRCGPSSVPSAADSRSRQIPGWTDSVVFVAQAVAAPAVASAPGVPPTSSQAPRRQVCLAYLLRLRLDTPRRDTPGSRIPVKAVGQQPAAKNVIFRDMTSEHLSRRSFLGMTAALPFAAAALGTAATKAPVGLKLYSVRNDLAKDLPGTVTAVGKMGYEVVEFYAPYLTWTGETAKDVRKRMDDVGLKCHSTHNNGPSFTEDGLKKAIELNQILGSTYIIMASAPKATGIDSWKIVAEQLTSVSEKLKPLKMATGYHNHQVEWRPIDGQRPMDV